jgi:hypothetical protein
LKEFQAVLGFFPRPYFVKFCHLLTDVVADCEFAVTRHDFKVLLIFEQLFADWVVAGDLAALGLMLVYL